MLVPSPKCSAEELDRDFRRDLFEGFLNLLGGVSEPVRVDVDSDATPPTAHGFAGLQRTYSLFEVVPAVRALKSDFMRITINHRECVP